MSTKLIDHSPDLKRLRDEGYPVEVRAGYLLVHNVPYVTAKREVRQATLASTLALAGNVTARPDTHVALFTGEYPCNKDGSPITQLQHAEPNQALGDGLVGRYSFSNKPPDGYADYYDKMTRYIQIISAPAQALDPNATPRTFNVRPTTEQDAIFLYEDTASSRAGILAAAEKLAIPEVSIIGIGGTGRYVLDLVAKTAVREIHLFDGDDFLQHNAFRAPAAASLETLQQRLKKVEYFARLYAPMRRGIIPHPYHITADNVAEVRGFVFVCIDKATPKQVIIPALERAGLSFIDVGMGIELVNGALRGQMRVTASMPEHRDHVHRRVSVADDTEGEYAQNIQIADLNALNAVLAVIKWKKIVQFYHDHEREHHSTYVLDTNQLRSDEQ
jgi:hypothetical protein